MSQKDPAPVMSGFLVSLDALYDTRLGTIARINPKLVEKVLSSKESADRYLNRESDFFSFVHADVFQKTYAERDIRTLRLSMMTPMIDVIMDFVKNTYALSYSTPFLQTPKVIVNTYPYVLPTGTLELIQKAIAIRLHERARVDIVYMTDEEITPSFLLKDVSMFCTYEPWKWLETQTQAKNFEKITCPSIGLYGPLMRKTAANDVTLSELVKAVDVLTKPFIGMDLLPIKMFSYSLGLKPGPIDRPPVDGETEQK